MFELREKMLRLFSPVEPWQERDLVLDWMREATELIDRLVDDVADLKQQIAER